MLAGDWHEVKFHGGTVADQITAEAGNWASFCHQQKMGRGSATKKERKKQSVSSESKSKLGRNCHTSHHLLSAPAAAAAGHLKAPAVK